MGNRVVVTGIGSVTCFGAGTDKLWNSVKEGKCGIDVVDKFDTSDLNTKLAAEVKDFDPLDYIEKKEIRKLDRFNQFAISSARMAVEDAGIDFSKVDLDRAGVIVGSGIGGFETLENQFHNMEEFGPRKVSPFFIPMMICNMSAGKIAINYGLRGINESVVTACATSNNCIGAAYRAIQEGHADIMITGGSEAAVTRLSFAGFCSMKAMSQATDPNSAVRPFDADRDGFIMGEGAGILVLESLESAINRGAKVYGEIVGFSATGDAYHITAPHPEGVGGIKAMQNALEEAKIDPSCVDYINAHGTSTKMGDAVETKIVKSVFGDHAKDLPVSSTKSMTGHLLGGAGAVEAIITLLAMRDNFLPPTINYKTPDPECDLDYVVNKGREKEINYALSNALGFGGHNAVVLFKKYTGD